MLSSVVVEAQQATAESIPTLASVTPACAEVAPDFDADADARASGRAPRRWVQPLKRWSSSFAGLLSRLHGARSVEAFAILTYHRVCPHSRRAPPPTWNVRPENLERQLRGLLARGFRPLALGSALDRHERGEPVPARSFVVTFDDGYENVTRYAVPILERLRVPATVFLATGYLDQGEPFPFDAWGLRWCSAVTETPETYRPLTIAQCHALAAGGWIELGCHTHSHRVFRDRPEALAADLEASVVCLRDTFGLDRPTFSFPFGICDERLLEQARRSGLRCALTTQAQQVVPGDSPFGWGRFTVEDRDSPGVLAGKLDGWYSLMRERLVRKRSVARPGASHFAIMEESLP